jgi:hypothetical protein
MTRHPVPGTDHWFDFRDLSSLTSEHQDQYLDLGDELRERKREAERERLIAEHPGMIPDPDQEIPVRLGRKGVAPIRDLVLSWVLEGSSFGVPLPSPLPLVASNVLTKALEPYYSALNGEVPEDPTPAAGASTSGSISGGTADASPPGQPSGPSGTPDGSPTDGSTP